MIVRIQSAEGVTFLDPATILRLHVPGDGSPTSTDDYNIEEHVVHADRVIRITQLAAPDDSLNQFALSFRTHPELLDALNTLGMPVGLRDVTPPRRRRNRDDD